MSAKSSKKWRLRITYSVDGPLRYASHLEMMRVWERSARRARLPLAYSGGFNPRPQIQIAAALPVGFAGDAEVVDLWLSEPLAPQRARQALEGKVPEGLSIIDATTADPSGPSLPSLVRAAEYEVWVETDQPAEEVRRRVGELLERTSLPRERRGRRYDLRRLIRSLRVISAEPGSVTLGMVLTATEGATGRPEEVVDALGLGSAFVRIRRKRLLMETAGTRADTGDRDTDPA